MKNIVAHRIVLLLFTMSTVATAQESSRGVYRVTEERIGGAARTGESNTIRYTVIDTAGISVARVERTLPYDVPFPTIGVFIDGTLMLVHAFDALIELYSPGGGAVSSVRPLREALPEHERVMRFSVQGSTAVFLVGEPSRPNASVFVVNARGKMLWEEEVAGSMAGGVAVSPDGEFVGASAYRWDGSNPLWETTILTSSGTKVASVPAGFTTGSFSQDGRRLVGFTPREWFLTEVKSGMILFRDLVGGDRMILDAVISGDEASVLVADLPKLEDGSWIYSHPVLETRDNNGSILRSETYPVASFKTAKLLPSGSSLKAEFDGAVYPR